MNVNFTKLGKYPPFANLCIKCKMSREHASAESYQTPLDSMELEFHQCTHVFCLILLCLTQFLWTLFLYYAGCQ